MNILNNTIEDETTYNYDLYYGRLSTKLTLDNHQLMRRILLVSFIKRMIKKSNPSLHRFNY